MIKQIFLYVGPHRSGSTFLDSEIFPCVPDVYCVRARDRECTAKIMNAFDEHTLFRDVEALKNNIYAHFDGVTESNIVISNPEFFGDYGHHDSGGTYIITPFHNHQSRAELLAKLFPGAKVILTFRRQDLWIESAYMHFIHNYFTVSVDEFLDRTPKFQDTLYRKRSAKPGCDVTCLDWVVYLKNYHRLFGAENVLVVPHDMLRNELPAALERLYAFMGVEPYFPKRVRHPGKSYSSLAYKMALVLNRFAITPQNRLGFIPSMPFVRAINAKRAVKDTRLLWFLAGISRRISLRWFLSDVVSRIGYRKPDLLGPVRRRAILDHYRDLNREFAKLIGIDLSKYGYY